MTRRSRFGVLALLIFAVLGLACVWMMGVGPVLVQAQENVTLTPTDQCIMVPWQGEPYRCNDGSTAAPPVVTETPTSTPSATNTPPAEHTPTVEPGGTPAPTDPGPTEVPLFTCQLRALFSINIRTGHGTNYPVVSTWTTDDRDPREFVAFYDGDRDYLWGQGAGGGWSVVYDKPAASWWAAGAVADWEKCPKVEGWPSGLLPPEPFAAEPALLWHAVPNANAMEMEASYAILAAKDIEFGVKPYADMNACLAALNAGGVCIFRHGAPDCPSGVGEVDPVESARQFANHGDWAASVLRNYDKAYYEPLNECWWGDPSHPTTYSWWNAWLNEYIDEAQRRNFPKLVIPTLGPANSSLAMYTAWKDVLQRSADMGNLFGEHIYTPYHDLGLCACDKWLACRHRTDQETRLSIGLDIEVAITEVARGWGNDPVDEADFVCWWGLVRNDSYVRAVAFWTAGMVFPWLNANLDGHMVAIAQQIPPRG